MEADLVKWSRLFSVVFWTLDIFATSKRKTKQYYSILSTPKHNHGNLLLSIKVTGDFWIEKKKQKTRAHNTRRIASKYCLDSQLSETIMVWW